MELNAIVEGFMTLVADGTIKIYNEFSLQHEFGIYLRFKFPVKQVQFERNVSYFGFDKRNFTKREIDIAIFQDDPRSLDLAIELKYPRNGQYPEQMFSFCKDIAFLEELRSAGFTQALFLVVVDQEPFYSGDNFGIYSYFRGGRPLHGMIKKPTGKKDSQAFIKGNYRVSWFKLSSTRRYAKIRAVKGS